MVDEKKPPSPSPEKKGPEWERPVQIVVGFIMWGVWTYRNPSINFEEVNGTELLWHGFPVILASILILGISARQVIEILTALVELVRAWTKK